MLSIPETQPNKYQRKTNIKKVINLLPTILCTIKRYTKCMSNVNLVKSRILELLCQDLPDNDTVSNADDSLNE